MKCLKCGCKKFGELRLSDFSVNVTEAEGIEPEGWNDDWEFDYIFCRDCFTKFKLIKENELVEITKDEMVEKTLDFLPYLLNFEVTKFEKEERQHIKKAIEKVLIVRGI